MRLIRLFLTIAVLLQFSLAQAQLRVTVSIAPLQETVNEIMLGAGQPQLLIPADQSPHHFAFKPSQFKKLIKADLVIWIDNHFESGMEPATSTLRHSVARLQLSSKLDHDLLHADHHFWYSPSQLINAVQSITTKLVELDPDNSDIYQNNAIGLIRRINDWRANMTTILNSQQTAVITQHQFLHSFSQDFNIEGFRSLANQHDDTGTIRNLREIEKHLETNPVECLLTLEPIVSSLAEGIVQKYSLKTVNINPAFIEGDQPSSILSRLEKLSSSLVDCQTTH